MTELSCLFELLRGMFHNGIYKRCLQLLKFLLVLCFYPVAKRQQLGFGFCIDNRAETFCLPVLVFYITLLRQNGVFLLGKLFAAV